MLATLASASSTTTALFAHERAATSLEDLGIVRKIVEREGCLEALTQLLTTHFHASTTQRSMTASATLAAAPMVVQSLLDQLRSVSVEIVERIDQWKHRHRDHAVFQWRRLNYLAKMLGDTAFLTLHTATVAQLPAFHTLRLQRNPFLSPLHLDHAALREASPEAACRLEYGMGSGTVDMKRLFYASRLLLQEEDALRKSESSTPEEVGMPPARLHWSHRPVTLTLTGSASAPSLGTADPCDPREALALDVELAKELVFQHEHELGAMREELAVVQRRLQTDLLLAPDKKRQLQTRVTALTHDLQLRTGDLFHRRNELQRKVAVLRMDKRRMVRAKEYTTALQHQQTKKGKSPRAATEEPIHFSESESFGAARQADELRRHELVEAFATYAKLQAAASLTERKLQMLASPHRLASSSPQRWSQISRPHTAPACGRETMSIPIEAMTVGEVEEFMAALPLGDDAKRYGALLRAKGIDGKLLVQAQHSDLEELGVTTRLHRVKIVEAIQQASGPPKGKAII